MGLEVKQITAENFRAYGRIVTDNFDLSELLVAMESTPLPEDVIYVPSVPELEALDVMEAFQEEFYGESPIQIGYCNGHNVMLNGLEYHRSSEVNIAVTDLIVMLGKQQDVEADFTYDTSKVEAFMIPAGTAVEFYATTLHYAPCSYEGKGFRNVVVLPKGTNTDLVKNVNRVKEDSLLVANNKWLIAHEDAKIDGAFCGLIGENLSV